MHRDLESGRSRRASTCLHSNTSESVRVAACTLALCARRCAKSAGVSRALHGCTERHSKLSHQSVLCDVRDHRPTRSVSVAALSGRVGVTRALHGRTEWHSKLSQQSLFCNVRDHERSSSYLQTSVFQSRCCSFCRAPHVLSAAEASPVENSVMP